MAHTEGGQLAKVSESQKVRRSPDWSLQLDSMKSESLVIVNQNVTVNTFRALYTPPVTPWEWAAKEAGSLTFGRTLATLWFMTGVKS